MISSPYLPKNLVRNFSWAEVYHRKYRVIQYEEHNENR